MQTNFTPQIAPVESPFTTVFSAIGNMPSIETRSKSGHRATLYRDYGPQPNGSNNPNWWGQIYTVDLEGNQWDRTVDTTDDNFGNLVEVQR